MLLAERALKLDPTELGAKPLDPLLELRRTGGADGQGDRRAQEGRAVRCPKPGLEVAGGVGALGRPHGRAVLAEGLLGGLLVGIDHSLLGEALARRLLHAGFEVTGFDLDPAKNARLQQALRDPSTKLGVGTPTR